MATQTFAYSYMFYSNGTLDADSYGSTTITTATDTLSQGDSLTAESGSFPMPFRYVGNTGDGIYVAYDDPEGGTFYRVFSNTAYAPGDTVTYIDDDYTLCFLQGTRIATPAGPVAIEDLRAGDLVLTADGGTREIVWMGRKRVAALFADPLKSYPVRIAAGALGDSRPERDLFVSPDHALRIDGLLVQANALVNGTSIARVPRPDATFTYFHIELADHSLVLAEGVPAETFVDNVTRSHFDNYAEYEARFGTEGPVAELDLPRVKSARQLPAGIQARLDARAAALGLARQQAA